jgi:hypothetical protein
MTGKRVLLVVLCFITFPFVSCDLNNDGIKFHFIPLQIVDADLPESFSLNEQYEIGVTYLRPNNCTTFEGFDIHETGVTIREVVAIGAEIEEQECMELTEEVQTTFKFVVLYSDSYLFKFWSGENADGEQEYLEIEVPVN